MARAVAAQPNLTLDRYRIIMNIPPWAFNGVDNPNEVMSGCDYIWSQHQREELATVLNDAEELMASHLRYTLGYEWQQDRMKPYTNPIVLNWGYIVGGGARATTEITAVSSDFTTDPATITVAQSDFPGGTDEILVVETSTGLEIVPDSISSSGANYVISIGQYKLVEWDDLEGQTNANPVDYNAAFPATTWLKLADLTIYREYRDVSDQADIIYGPECACFFTSGAACSGISYDGCVYVLDPEISSVTVQAASYNATTGLWTLSSVYLSGCYEGDFATIDYLAGSVDRPGYERAIRGYAHAMLEWQPCGCAPLDNALKRDRRVPRIMSAERINCPFGPEDGAWYAWMWVMNNMLGEAILAGPEQWRWDVA